MCLLRIATLSLLLLTGSLTAKTLTIATGAVPPYASPRLYQQGYVNHIVKEAFAIQGYQVNYVFFPWARAYEETIAGHFDATSYWLRSDKHNAHFYYSQPVHSEQVVFFQRKTNGPTNWKSLSDFNQLLIGLTRGYTYTSELWQLAKKYPQRFSIVNTDKQNLKMLAMGRIDLFPIDEAIGWYLANRHLASEQANRLETLSKPLTIEDAHILFPKSKPNSQSLLKTFNEGLAELRASGRLAQFEEDLITGRYSQPYEANATPQ